MGPLATGGWCCSVLARRWGCWFVRLRAGLTGGGGLRPALGDGFVAGDGLGGMVFGGALIDLHRGRWRGD